MSKKVSHIGFDHPSMKTGFWSLSNVEKDLAADQMVKIAEARERRANISLVKPPKDNPSGQPRR